ncbi:lipoyltransferase 1, mitochondrial [Uranotaenia lowii]|uniref:lipoyltransferase 1, mitochondrial n=1 Tax=Uranotaenia lowii TaxID=190385 RepID=UPI00247A95F4|nr:lipoyltransferase 1, mitochondrial [Uranotaenia lowii]
MAALIIQSCSNTVARAVCKWSSCTNTTLLRTITTTTPRSITNNGGNTTNNNNNNKGKQLSAAEVKKIPDSEVKKSVFISQSNDIFTNLALEDWIYRNFDFSHHHILMLWINTPTVVIGRHQNPFCESNVSALVRNGVELARRNSGGGAVYHDLGNLNCTFFSPRARYDRKYNLNLITRALYREYGISAEISSRDDITLMGKKISGTAAKLGQPNAYHHCTLLVNSNKLHLGESLVKDNAEIISKATASVPSPIKNLADVNRSVNIQQLLSAIGYEYLRTPATQLTDGGRDLLMKQLGFQLINPTEKWFPGLSELREGFASWDWRIGKTPKFAVQKSVQLKSEGNQQHEMKVNVEVEKGCIQEISILIPGQDPIPVVSSMVGKPYQEDCFNGILEALKGASAENVKHAMGL